MDSFPKQFWGPDFNAGPPEPEVRTPVFTEPHWTLFFDRSVRKQWLELVWSSSTQTEIS